VNLMYETESNKLLWDPTRPHKFLHVDEIKEIRTGPNTQQYCFDLGMSESYAYT
jgi:phosphatidylinositol phospholipase C delta